MCLGLPMRVIALPEFPAGERAWSATVSPDLDDLGERSAEVREVSTALVDEVTLGDLLLIHLDAAIRPLDREEAEQIRSALEGLALAEQGGRAEDLRGLFADLEGRTPQLPEHLRSAD